MDRGFLFYASKKLYNYKNAGISYAKFFQICLNSIEESATLTIYYMSPVHVDSD